MAVDYFQGILRSPASELPPDVGRYFTRRIPEDMVQSLASPVSDEEIRTALFSIPEDKAPGPDGYTSFFYKRCWGIIGTVFRAAVRYFFTTSVMPTWVNSTRITLVPKLESPQTLSDFRPISCCNVLYKCISKIIANRFRVVLPEVIGRAQMAFVPGRQIADAIFLTQELMHDYHLDRSPPRCALKVDIRKAFDTVSWEFILLGLKTIGVPDCMISWIEACLRSAHFSVALNGALHGYFSATRGVRQGDPLSPYLFVLAMEGLDGILREATADPSFRHHWRCRQTSLTHLCFADDLMIFSRADSASLEIIRQALTDFERVSGLAMNSAKSRVFFSGIPEDESSSLQRVLGIQIGSLPIRYLGVPLITTRLRHSDCLPLVERILSRIRLWTSASLTYAGRLQLIRSVLFSIQVYWSGMFILPASISRRIESILSAFLWKGTSLSHTGAKVAWESVCFPRQEGGLGVRRVRDWNRAAVLKYVWRLFADRSSSWSIWVHTVLLRGRSFWHIRVPSSSSWVWRKILMSRDWCRGLIVACIGDGRDTSLWQDYWLPDQEPLCDRFPFRTLSSTGLSWDARVSEIIDSGEWAFPEGSSELQQIWDSIRHRPRVLHSDSWVWKGHPSGAFSIDSAWNLLRARRPVDPIHHLLWFPDHIPRHSFILWLASLGRLRTMDRLQMFGVLSDPTCVLCSSAIETHEHLFFHCRFSSSVWGSLSTKTLTSWPSFSWSPLLQWASSHLRRRKDFRHFLSRLVFSATVYFLWYERNNRIFSRRHRSPQDVIEDISETIRFRLFSLETRFQIPDLQRHIWKLPT